MQIYSTPREVESLETGLAENRCLERRRQGAQLLQVGEQEIAFGTKFRARVVLDIQVPPQEPLWFRAASPYALHLIRVLLLHACLLALLLALREEIAAMNALNIFGRRCRSSGVVFRRRS